MKVQLMQFGIKVTHLLLWMVFPILIRLFLLQGFERFRMDETLCDVVLVPGDSDEAFRVHRVIMALSSDYFKAMFTGENTGQTNKNDNTDNSFTQKNILAGCPS